MAVDSATAVASPSSAGGLALTARQKSAVLKTASEIIRATASGEETRLDDSLLEGAAAQAVAGVFVSLKRGKHLRSCCGSLTEKASTLGKSLHEAAVRTACDDVRFPPVS